LALWSISTAGEKRNPQANKNELLLILLGVRGTVSISEILEMAWEKGHFKFEVQHLLKTDV
jgi:hypothetical protein